MKKAPGPPRWLRIAILAIAVSVLAIQAFGARRVAQRVGRPFPGFVVSPDLVVSQLNQPYWKGILAGLRPGDHVRAVDGTPVASAAELSRIVERRSVGSEIRYRIARGGEALDFRIRSSTFGREDFVSTYGLLSLTAIGFLAVGSLVAWRRYDLLGGGVYAFSLAVALATGVFNDLPALPLAEAWQGVLVGALLHFAMVFPEPLPRLRDRPWIVLLGYFVGLPLAVANVAASAAGSTFVARIDEIDRWATFAAAFVLASRLAAGLRGSATGTPARDRARIASWGLVLAAAGYATGFLGAELGLIPSAPASFFVAPAWLWLAAIAVASVRDDVFGLAAADRERLAGFIALAIPVLFYLLFLAVLRVAFREVSEDWRWLLAPGVLLLAVLAVEPLRRMSREAARRIVDAPLLFSPRTLRDLTEEIAASLDEEEIRERVEHMAPRLGLARTKLVLGDDGEHDSAGFDLVFPLRFRSESLGLLASATPTGEGALGRDDVTGFSTLTAQIAMALENARIFRRIVELEKEVRAENVVLREVLASSPALEGLVGESPRMKRLYQLIERTAPTGTTILLRGETGTGKELVARAIHARSRRRDRPMIRVNCAAIHPSLLESEFFGHERGAFTGAVGRKIGRFELAAGGTIFLDEIGDLPLELQPKLLRVLQEKEFERVGGSAILRSDARVIAATNRDLEALVHEGRFREDLFFRLNVFPIVVPPLRDRREDIHALAAHLIQRYASKAHKRITSIDERSLRALVAYDWPGNVRELENVIERSVVLCEDERLIVRDLEPPEAAAGRAAGLRPLSEILRDVKVRTIRRALVETAGNQARAAALLRMKPSSLSRMMKSLGLRP